MVDCVVCGEPTSRKVPSKTYTIDGTKPCKLPICLDCHVR